MGSKINFRIHKQQNKNSNNKANIEKYQDNLSSGTEIGLQDKDTIKYAMTPLGKAIYFHAHKNKVGRPRKPENEKAKPSDRLICNVCGEQFIRNNRYRHYKTKIHNAYAGMNAKIRELLKDK